MKRKGFTLIELVVAMAIFFILIYMAFASFSYILAFSRYNKQRENVQENITIVMDQITKEIRQTVTEDIGEPLGKYGVEYPAPPSSESTPYDHDSIRNIATIADPDPPLSSDQYYSFGANDPDASDDSDHPILTFYIKDSNEVKHRISYSLDTPKDSSGNYNGIPRRYWPSDEWEPCEIVYSNQTWDSSSGSWSGIRNQPVTEQVITNFTVIRPSWSDKVIQVVIEAMVKAPTSKGYEKIRYINQITLRQ